MGKRDIGSQCLLSQLAGRIIFDRHDMRPLGIIEYVVLQASDLSAAYFVCRTTDLSRAYIRTDQTAMIGKHLSTNDAANFGEPDDFVRDHEIITADCRLLGYKVENADSVRLGRIIDVSISLPHMQIMRLHIKPPLIHSWRATNLVIARSAILDIDLKKQLVIVESSAKNAVQPIVEVNPA